MTVHYPHCSLLGKGDVRMHRRKRRGSSAASRTKPRGRLTDAQYRILQKNGTIDLYGPRFDREVGSGDDAEFLVEGSGAVVHAHLADVLRGEVFNKVIVTLREP